jgi:hypothetical protein
VSKIFAHFVPLFFQFFAGVVSPGVRKYYLVLRALEMPLSFVGWALASLLSFTPVSNHLSAYYFFVADFRRLWSIIQIPEIGPRRILI